MEERNEILLAAIKSLLRKDELDKAITILSKAHPADAAEIVSELSDEDQKRIFESWDPPHSADTLLEMDDREQVEIAESLNDALVSDILEEMPSDDAADLLGDLPPSTTEKILGLMKQKQAAEVRRLLAHGKNTAGGLMTREFIAIRKDMTAEAAIGALRDAASELETIYYVFVVNDEGQLVGVISLRDLILAASNTLIKKIMNPHVIYTDAGADQEEVAKMMSKYDLIALPVVDKNHELLGVVTIDDVVDVIEEEATEDMYRISGTGAAGQSDVLGNKLPVVIRARVPWLLIALLGEVLVVGFVASRYTMLLETFPALAIYWACMTSVGGNTSFQASTVVVRGLATGEIEPKTLLLRILYEVRLGLIMGAMMAILLFVIALFWQRVVPLAVTVAVASVAIVVSGALTGAIAPIVFDKLGIDPAVSSSPFLALVMDGVSLFLYFAIAALVLRAFRVI